MKTIILKITFLLLTVCSIAQEKTNIDPTGNLYLGIEGGTNIVKSLETENKEAIQFGAKAEYYFARHWSLSTGIKYYDIGVSYYTPGSSSGNVIFNLDSQAQFGNFKGNALTVPLQIKWEFRLYKNLGASLNLGATYTFETKSEYGAYSSDKKVNFSNNYGGFISGIGINYFLNKNSALYFSYESISGSVKGEYSGFIFSDSKNTFNQLTSIGYKYVFKRW